MSDPTPPHPAPGALPGGRPTSPVDNLQDSQRKALDLFAGLIAESPHNLVSRAERDRVRSVHIAECLLLGGVLLPDPGERWMDLGTGGGLPGLVLAIQFPHVHWTLVDSVGKKVTAVEAFADALGLRNVSAVRGRAEELGHQVAYREHFAGVVSRALAVLPVVMELSRAFLHDGGLLVAVKGPSVVDELPQAERARTVLRLGSIHRAALPDAARPTVVVTMRAHGSPPRQYPRKVGLPAVAPLGGRTT